MKAKVVPDRGKVVIIHGSDMGVNHQDKLTFTYANRDDAVLDVFELMDVPGRWSLLAASVSQSPGLSSLWTVPLLQKQRGCSV